MRSTAGSRPAGRSAAQPRHHRHDGGVGLVRSPRRSRLPARRESREGGGRPPGAPGDRRGRRTASGLKPPGQVPGARGAGAGSVGRTMACRAGGRPRRAPPVLRFRRGSAAGSSARTGLPTRRASPVGDRWPRPEPPHQRLDDAEVYRLPASSLREQVGGHDATPDAIGIRAGFLGRLQHFHQLPGFVPRHEAVHGQVTRGPMSPLRDRSAGVLGEIEVELPVGVSGPGACIPTMCWSADAYASGLGSPVPNRTPGDPRSRAGRCRPPGDFGRPVLGVLCQLAEQAA